MGRRKLTKIFMQNAAQPTIKNKVGHMGIVAVLLARSLFNEHIFQLTTRQLRATRLGRSAKQLTRSQSVAGVNPLSRAQPKPTATTKTSRPAKSDETRTCERRSYLSESQSQCLLDANDALAWVSSMALMRRSARTQTGEEPSRSSAHFGRPTPVRCRAQRLAAVAAAVAAAEREIPVEQTDASSFLARQLVDKRPTLELSLARAT